MIDATDYQLEATPWADQAACAGVSGDEFFPERGASVANAKALCAACPVRFECLDYALRWRIPHGIWGGLSTRERQRLPKVAGPRRFPPRHGTATRYHQGCRCEPCVRAQAGREVK